MQQVTRKDAIALYGVRYRPHISGYELFIRHGNDPLLNRLQALANFKPSKEIPIKEVLGALKPLEDEEQFEFETIVDAEIYAHTKARASYKSVLAELKALPTQPEIQNNLELARKNQRNSSEAFISAYEGALAKAGAIEAILDAPFDVKWKALPETLRMPDVILQRGGKVFIADIYPDITRSYIREALVSDIDINPAHFMLDRGLDISLRYEFSPHAGGPHKDDRPFISAKAATADGEIGPVCGEWRRGADGEVNVLSTAFNTEVAARKYITSVARAQCDKLQSDLTKISNYLLRTGR